MSNPRSEIFSSNEILHQLQEDYCLKSNYSNEQFEALLNWMMEVPHYTTVRYNNEEKWEPCLKDLCSILNKQFKSFVPSADKHKILPDLFIIPSIITNDVVPLNQGKEIIVDNRCGVAVLRGANIFAPGVLSAPSHLEIGNKVSVYADLEGKCLKGATKLFTGKKHFLGNGIATLSRQDLFNSIKPSGVAIEITEKMVNCPALADILGSQMFLQNLPSVVCSHVLNPAPGEHVLDMCAAPGGKTSHIASLMKNKGVVLALDKNTAKISKLNKTVEAQGFTIVSSFPFNSVKSVNQNGIQDQNNLMPPFPPGSFDKVLLDAPCSSLGQRPQLFNKMSINELKSYPVLQRKLFDAAVQLLKTGGVLVYSTCTLVMAENEELVAWALKKYRNLILETQVPHLGGFGLKGSELNDEERQKLQRFDAFSPGIGPDGDTIGFFIAKFRKKLNT